MDNDIILRGLGLILIFIAAWYLVPYGLRRIAEKRLAATCRQRRAIALTYDDGPGPELTPRLLHLLAQEDVLATFFVLGTSGAVSPTLIRDTLAAGHEVGSHTYHHANAWKTGPLKFHNDMRAGVRFIVERSGNGRFFRPPYGKLTLGGLLAVMLRKMRLGWWTIDSQDSWARRPINDVLHDVADQGGGVILMHDLDRYRDESSGVSHQDYVLDLTRRLILYARANDFQILRLSDLA